MSYVFLQISGKKILIALKKALSGGAVFTGLARGSPQG
jgi:hypothetical protein